MEIAEETESRRPILTIAHSVVTRLASPLPKVDDSQIIQSSVDLPVATNFFSSDLGSQSFSQGMDTLLLSNTTKEVSNILNKLHELFRKVRKDLN